jgi:hypothetical protein
MLEYHGRCITYRCRDIRLARLFLRTRWLPRVTYCIVTVETLVIDPADDTNVGQCQCRYPLRTRWLPRVTYCIVKVETVVIDPADDTNVGQCHRRYPSGVAPATSARSLKYTVNPNQEMAVRTLSDLSFSLGCTRGMIETARRYHHAILCSTLGACPEISAHRMRAAGCNVRRSVAPRILSTRMIARGHGHFYNSAILTVSTSCPLLQPHPLHHAHRVPCI